MRFVARDALGKPLANKPYVLLMKDGTTRSGTTGAMGQTEQLVTDGPQSVNVYIEDFDHEGFHLTTE